MSTRQCPACGSFFVRRSQRRGILENVVLRLLLLRPYRCGECYVRHYELVWSVRAGKDAGSMGDRAGLNPASLVLLLVCSLLSPYLLLRAADVHRSLVKRWNEADQRAVMLELGGAKSATGQPSSARAQANPLLLSANCCGAPRFPAGPGFTDPAWRQRMLERKAAGRLVPSGEVFVNDLPVTVETTVYPGDVVRTGAGGAGRVEVAGRGSILLASETQLEFSQEERFFATLQKGRLVLSSLPGATNFQIRVGFFLAVPSAETAASAEFSLAADGNGMVQVSQGMVGVIAMEGPAAAFLRAGERAQLMPSGEIQPLRGAPSQPPAETLPAEGKAVKKGGRGALVGLAVGGAAAAGLAAAMGKGGDSRPVSPSSP